MMILAIPLSTAIFFATQMVFSLIDCAWAQDQPVLFQEEQNDDADDAPRYRLEQGKGLTPNTMRAGPRLADGIDDLRMRPRSVKATLDSVLKRSDRIKLGIVSFRTRFSVDDTDRRPAVQSNEPTSLPFQQQSIGFDVPIAEFYVTGRLFENTSYYTEFNAQAGGNILRTMAMDFRLHKNMRLRFGQFRLPLGLENNQTSGFDDFINRGYNQTVDLTDGPTGNTNRLIQDRDIGVMVSGNIPWVPIQAHYGLAVINGSGRNKLTDDNNHKDIVGKLTLKPSPGLIVGGGAYWGKERDLTALEDSGTLKNFDRFRWVVDFDARPRWLPGLHARGEFFQGHDGSVQRRFYYLYAGYRLDRIHPTLQGLEPIIRHDEFDSNRQAGDKLFTRTTFGLNYYLFGDNVKFMTNYEVRSHAGGSKTDPFNNNLFSALVQFRY